MIEYIKGHMVEKNPACVVLECNGVGYFINISLCTYGKLADAQQVKLYIHTVIREDSHILFGFFSKDERDIFRKLISVSGVGAGTARTILSSLEPEEVVRAVGTGDAAVFKNVKGIGLKTAQRIILDLKGKMDVSLTESISSAEGMKTPQMSSVRNEALDALEILGFIRKNCEKYVDDILLKYPSATVENLIKMTLKAM